MSLRVADNLTICIIIYVRVVRLETESLFSPDYLQPAKNNLVARRRRLRKKSGRRRRRRLSAGEETIMEITSNHHLSQFDADENEFMQNAAIPAEIHPHLSFSALE